MSDTPILDKLKEDLHNEIPLHLFAVGVLKALDEVHCRLRNIELAMRKQDTDCFHSEQDFEYWRQTAHTYEQKIAALTDEIAVLKKQLFEKTEQLAQQQTEALPELMSESSRVRIENGRLLQDKQQLQHHVAELQAKLNTLRGNFGRV